MKKQDFETLCEQNAEWERFKKECLEHKENVMSRDRIVEILPDNIMEFAFQEWKDKGRNLFCREEVFKVEPANLQLVTIEEATKDMAKLKQFWWPKL